MAQWLAQTTHYRLVAGPTPAGPTFDKNWISSGMKEVSPSTESPQQETAPVPSKRLRVWLIAISIMAIILFLIDTVLAFAIISTSLDHLRTGSKSISTNNDITVPYSVNDFHNDLEIEIPAILVSFVVLGSGSIGGRVLQRRKPKFAFVLSLLVLISFLATFLLALLLVFS